MAPRCMHILFYNLAPFISFCSLNFYFFFFVKDETNSEEFSLKKHEKSGKKD